MKLDKADLLSIRSDMKVLSISGVSSYAFVMIDPASGFVFWVLLTPTLYLSLSDSMLLSFPCNSSFIESSSSLWLGRITFQSFFII
jgi:hypothetical protein